MLLEQWGRPPSFLLVDFYDVGDGSVFEVAARANGVKYRRSCCSKKKDKDGGGKSASPRSFGAVNVGVTWILTLVLAVLLVAGGPTGDRWGWGL